MSEWVRINDQLINLDSITGFSTAGTDDVWELRASTSPGGYVVVRSGFVSSAEAISFAEDLLRRTNIL